VSTTHRSARELILLDAGGAKAAPTELLIFPFGTIATLKGDFRFTRRSATAVQAQWARLGRDVGFDYEHGLFDSKTPGKDRDAAGWGKLEVRASGLWIVGIRWTATAAQKIVSLAFRYLSPAFKADPRTGEVLTFENCALTNYPATLRAAPLMLSHLLGMADTTQDTKHGALAKGLMRGCSAVLAAAQAAAESDNAELKKMGEALAGAMPEHLATIKAAFPDMGEPDGDEGEEKTKKMAAVFDLVEKLTGVKDGHAGALLALKAQADAKVTQASASEDTQRKALVDKLIKETRQVHPQDRATFETLSVADLQAYGKSAPRIGPKGGAELEGAVELSGKPETLTAKRAEAAAALVALGHTPEEAAQMAAQVN